MFPCVFSRALINACEKRHFLGLEKEPPERIKRIIPRPHTGPERVSVPTSLVNLIIHRIMSTIFRGVLPYLWGKITPKQNVCCRQNNGPPKMSYVLIPRIYEYFGLHAKGELRQQIELRLLIIDPKMGA